MGSGVREFVDPCELQSHLATDDNGTWEQFLPGGKCEEIYVFVREPDGYQATTDLASNGCHAKFGFAPDGVPVERRVRSIEEFVQRNTILMWIRRIIIGLIILAVGILGTIWLQKEPKAAQENLG